MKKSFIRSLSLAIKGMLLLMLFVSCKDQSSVDCSGGAAGTSKCSSQANGGGTNPSGGGDQPIPPTPPDPTPPAPGPANSVVMSVSVNGVTTNGIQARNGAIGKVDLSFTTVAGTGATDPGQATNLTVSSPGTDTPWTFDKTTGSSCKTVDSSQNTCIITLNYTPRSETEKGNTTISFSYLNNKQKTQTNSTTTINYQAVPAAPFNPIPIKHGKIYNLLVNGSTLYVNSLQNPKTPSTYLVNYFSYINLTDISNLISIDNLAVDYKSGKWVGYVTYSIPWVDKIKGGVQTRVAEALDWSTGGDNHQYTFNLSISSNNNSGGISFPPSSPPYKNYVEKGPHPDPATTGTYFKEIKSPALIVKDNDQNTTLYFTDIYRDGNIYLYNLDATNKLTASPALYTPSSPPPMTLAAPVLSSDAQSIYVKSNENPANVYKVNLPLDPAIVPIKWSLTNPSSSSNLVINDSYFFVGDDQGIINIYDPSQPVSTPPIQFKAFNNSPVTQLIMQGNTLYALSPSKVVAIDISNINSIKIVQSFSFTGSGNNMVFNSKRDILYVGGNSTVYALKTADFSKLWSGTFTSNFGNISTLTLSPAENIVYIGSDNSNVIAFSTVIDNNSNFFGPIQSRSNKVTEKSLKKDEKKGGLSEDDEEE